MTGPESMPDVPESTPDAPTEALTPVSALDAIRTAARTAVDCPESERMAALIRLGAALDAYNGLLSAWATAMGEGQQYRANEPPPWIDPHRSGIDVRGIEP